MAGSERRSSPPALLGCCAAPSHFSRHTPPSMACSWGRKWNSSRWRAIRIAARLRPGQPDPLLRAALRSAWIRDQESRRPDPLFIDPYAGGLFDSDMPLQDMEEQPFSSTLNPCHYRLATKFIDDKLHSLISSSDELRQIVILTDGMDTRAYRLTWSRMSIIFDLSPERVFKIADQKFKEMGAKISRNCVLFHIPLESPDLQESFYKRGFDGNRLSLWLLQGLPLSTTRNLNDLLQVVSSLAMKGSIFLGELPSSLMEPTTSAHMPAEKEEWLEKLFMSHGFQFSIFNYKDIARNEDLDAAPPTEHRNVLFVAEQLRLSDSQMESWRMHLQRIEEEGDEEGFEEL